MKKIIAIILAVLSMAFLASCKSGVEFYELDPIKVNGISYVLAPDTQIDKEAFAEAYNNAKIDDSADEDDVSGDVIVVTLTDGKVLTLYYLEDEDFAVTGNAVEKSYIIEAPELAKLYCGEVHPVAEFEKLEADDGYSVILSAKPDVKVDTAAFIKAYNEAKLVGEAEDVKGGNNVIIFISEDEGTVNVSYIGDNRFAVSGAGIKVPYIISSTALADLYKEAVK